MTRLTVEGLHAGYGDKTVLRDVNVDVADGQTLGVLGPSGCGKTTLLLAIAGLLEPTQGRIRLDGHDITSLPAERRGTVLLHQENTLFPHLNVAKNVDFGLRLRRVGSDDRGRRVRELLEMVSLEGFERRAVEGLSGGEKQRVMLARALAVDPKVLLLDEPLTALDRSLRVRLREELRELLKDLGITSVFVTHDQEEAAWMGDRLMLMEAGRALDEGDPHRVHRRPASSDAARLLGHRNVFPYRRTDEGRLRTALGDLDGPDDAAQDGVLLIREDEVQFLATDAAGGEPAHVVERRDLVAHAAIRVRVRDAELRADVPYRADPPEPGPTRVLIPADAVHTMPE